MVGTELGDEGFEDFADDADDFAARLREAADEIETGEHIDVRMGEAVEELADDMRRRAPVDTGELKESIRIEPQHDNGEYAIVVDAPHGVHQEYGTMPHPIPKETDVGTTTLHFMWPGGGADGGDVEVFAARVDHPGHLAQPFVRPAIDENDDDVAEAIHDAIEEVIERTL